MITGFAYIMTGIVLSLILVFAQRRGNGRRKHENQFFYQKSVLNALLFSATLPFICSVVICLVPNASWTYMDTIGSLAAGLAISFLMIILYLYYKSFSVTLDAGRVDIETILGRKTFSLDAGVLVKLVHGYKGGVSLRIVNSSGKTLISISGLIEDFEDLVSAVQKQSTISGARFIEANG